MQNKKIFTTDVPTHTRVGKLTIRPNKEFTDIKLKELGNVSMFYLAPMLLFIATEFNLDIKGNSQNFMWKGNALTEATRILENSVNYN